MGAVRAKTAPSETPLTLAERLAAATAQLKDLHLEMRDEVQRLQGDLEEERDRAISLESDVAEAEREAAALRERVPELDDQVTELARVRACLKAGRCDEGRQRLERVLDDLDGAWRTRA